MPALETLLQHAGLAMPYTHFETDMHIELENASQLMVAAQLLPSGFISMEVAVMTINYTARWINPLWLCAPHSQRRQIGALVLQAVNV